VAKVRPSEAKVASYTPPVWPVSGGASC
jgi:hypothetical protein